jgi:hypothetical protein
MRATRASRTRAFCAEPTGWGIDPNRTTSAIARPAENCVAGAEAGAGSGSRSADHAIHAPAINAATSASSRPMPVSPGFAGRLDR